MVRAYLSAKSARLIMAFLLFGSISGFILGQELHHPPVAHQASLITASVSDSLSAATFAAPQPVTRSSLTRVVPITMSPHQKHQKHHDDNASIELGNQGVSAYDRQNSGGSGDGGNS